MNERGGRRTSHTFSKNLSTWHAPVGTSKRSRRSAAHVVEYIGEQWIAEWFRIFPLPCLEEPPTLLHRVSFSAVCYRLSTRHPTAVPAALATSSLAVAVVAVATPAVAAALPPSFHPYFPSPSRLCVFNVAMHPLGYIVGRAECEFFSDC